MSLCTKHHRVPIKGTFKGSMHCYQLPHDMKIHSTVVLRYMFSLDLPLNGDNYQVIVLTLHLIFDASLRFIASVGNIKCRVNNVEVIHQCELVGAVMFRNFQNCVCVCAAVVQRSPGPQGATAREAEHVTEERAGETQVTVRTVI